MTLAEKWAWHAETYAFRIVALGLPADDRTSPCDPNGDWYNEELVRAAAARLRDKREQAGRRRRSVLDSALVPEGRAACNAWAKVHGYADWATAEADGHEYTEVARSFSPQKMPRQRAGHYRPSDLGVASKEHPYTPEEMAAARRDAGIE